MLFTTCKKEDDEPNTGTGNNNNNPSSIIGYGWGNDILYKTTDGGVTWNFVNNLPSIGDENKLSFSSEDVGVFGGLNFNGQNGNWASNYSMYYSTTVSGGLGFTDGDWTWNATGNNGAEVLDWNNGSILFEASDNTFYFSLYDGKLRKYQIANDGSMSIPIYIYEDGVVSYMTFNTISFVDANIGFATSNNGSVSKTTNGGSSWSIVGSLSAVSNLSFPSANVGYATDDSWLYKTTDGGNNWTQLTQININNIEFVTDNIGYGFFSNMLYQTTDGGDNWSMINDNSIGLSLLSFMPTTNSGGGGGGNTGDGCVNSTASNYDPSATMDDGSCEDYIGQFKYGGIICSKSGLFTGTVCSEYDEGSASWSETQSYCDSYTYSGYSDWYTPSVSQLLDMYYNLHLQGIGGFGTSYINYWSSTACECVYVGSDGQVLSVGCQYGLMVRPVRDF